MKFVLPLVASVVMITASSVYAGDVEKSKVAANLPGASISSQSGNIGDANVARLTGSDVLASGCIPAVGSKTTIGSVSGPVLVSHNGAKFVPAISGSKIGPNDRIQVLNGGAGQLQRGTCTSELPRDGFVQLAAAPAAAAAAGAAASSAGTAAAATGIAGAVASVGTVGVIAGVAAVGAVGLAVSEAVADNSP